MATTFAADPSGGIRLGHVTAADLLDAPSAPDKQRATSIGSTGREPAAASCGPPAHVAHRQAVAPESMPGVTQCRHDRKPTVYHVTTIPAVVGRHAHTHRRGRGAASPTNEW